MDFETHGKREKKAATGTTPDWSENDEQRYAQTVQRLERLGNYEKSARPRDLSKLIGD